MRISLTLPMVAAVGGMTLAMALGCREPLAPDRTEVTSAQLDLPAPREVDLDVVEFEAFYATAQADLVNLERRILILEGRAAERPDGPSKGVETELAAARKRLNELYRAVDDAKIETWQERRPALDNAWDEVALIVESVGGVLSDEPTPIPEAESR